MKRSLQVIVTIAVGSLLMFGTGCKKLQARDQLNKGVGAFKNAKYEQAIEHFTNAENLDPNLAVAKLYLATACRQQWVPGVDSADNNKWAQCSIDQYQAALRESNIDETSRVTATKGIADIYFNSKKFEDAKKYQNEVLKLDPKDAETHYSIGVIDWTMAFQHRQDLRAQLGIQKPDERIKDKKVCPQLQASNEPIIDEGIAELDKAMALRQDYDDAMAYMNLLYREKAHVACNDDEAYQTNVKKADEYVEQTMAAKKRKAEKAAQAGAGGVVLDENK